MTRGDSIRSAHGEFGVGAYAMIEGTVTSLKGEPAANARIHVDGTVARLPLVAYIVTDSTGAFRGGIDLVTQRFDTLPTERIVELFAVASPPAGMRGGSVLSARQGVALTFVSPDSIAPPTRVDFRIRVIPF